MVLYTGTGEAASTDLNLTLTSDVAGAGVGTGAGDASDMQDEDLTSKAESEEDALKIDPAILSAYQYIEVHIAYHIHTLSLCIHTCVICLSFIYTFAGDNRSDE